MLQRTLLAGFIAAVPRHSNTTDSGSSLRKDGAEVKLYSRPGNDFTRRFPPIIEALARLPSQSSIIDGEVVACGDNGAASFDHIRYRRHDGDVFLYAFDLIELRRGHAAQSVRSAQGHASKCLTAPSASTSKLSSLRSPGGWPRHA
jgi:bifunctional non-homologous end joining protein LigD